MNLPLFPRQVRIGKYRFLPCSICAQVPEIVSKGARQQFMDNPANISTVAWTKIKLAQLLQQLVHQRQQQLPLGAEVLIESSHCKLRTPSDLVYGSALITLLSKQGHPGRFQSCPLLQTSLLLRCRRKVLTGEQVRTHTHALVPGRMTTPASAPAQHQSIHPPKTPATSGAIFGNTTGKNALENGSSKSVGSAIEIAPAGHCSTGS